MADTLPLTSIELEILFKLPIDWMNKLSDTSSYHFNGLVDTFDRSLISDFKKFILDSIDLHKKFLKESQLDENDTLLILRGIEYFNTGINPSKKDILMALLSDSKFSFFADNMRDNLSSYQKDATSKSYLKQQVEYIFKYIIQGYNIIKYENFLKSYLIILQHETAFFELKMASGGTGKQFRELIEKIDWLASMNVKPGDTISDVCENKKLVQFLKDQFEQLITPDRKRTIEDRILKIEKLAGITKEEGQRAKYFEEGFLYAVRGENPQLIDLDSFEKSRWYYGFNETYLESIKEILNGYANAFHLKFLQDLLASLNKSVATESIPENKEILLQLKWAGNNNQLYDVIRQLKKSGLLLNSYPELAFFLKRTINKLESTSLSTIQKELEKEKRPTKQRRIELDLSSNSEDV